MRLRYNKIIMRGHNSANDNTATAPEDNIVYYKSDDIFSLVPEFDGNQII